MHENMYIALLWQAEAEGERVLLHGMPQTSSSRGGIWAGCVWWEGWVWGNIFWPSIDLFKSFFFATMLTLSYLRLHANSTDKIEIEQHCTLLMQNSQWSSESISAWYPSGPSKASRQAEAEKNYIHQLYQAESATIAGKGRGQKTVAKQFCSITERSDVVHTRVSQHAGRPQDMISHSLRLASYTQWPAHILRPAS